MRFKKYIIAIATVLIGTYCAETSFGDYFHNHVKNWGLETVQIPNAWGITRGSRKVVVAVIDTGIDVNHQDLSKNIWHDVADNDYNYGWNFVTNEPNPLDDHGHGTHVAGIIGAITDTYNGVSGVSPNVSIMSIKYYSGCNLGSVNLRNTVKAINYAVDHGAKVINYSSSGPEFNEDEYLAIKNAENNGVLFVTAVGNDHMNVDFVNNYTYPASYRLTNIISVAATDINDSLLSSSNFGAHRVDISAPGENIFSTFPGGRYGYMSGTSQATAFVSGVAALLLSKNPSLTPQQIKKVILSSADKVPKLTDKVIGGRRLNAYSALKLIRK